MISVTPKQSPQQKIEKILLKVKAVFYSLFHLRDLCRVMKLRRKHGGIQLRSAELIKAFHAIGKFDQCNMLIYGLGNDSPFWCEANAGGRTVFLEDFQPWFDKITAKFPEIEAYPVNYPGNITRWKELMDHPERLSVNLPPEIRASTWDMILVDGPRGHKYSKDIPGRMSSIYTASLLVGKGGYVFVHDAERTVEAAYATRFLGEDHLLEKIRGRALLKIYRF